MKQYRVSVKRMSEVKQYRVSVKRMNAMSMGRSYIVKASRDGLAVDRAMGSYYREVSANMRTGEAIQIIVEREA